MHITFWPQQVRWIGGKGSIPMNDMVCGECWDVD
jgi:hypothetical protein